MPQIRGAFPLPISNLFEGMGRIVLQPGAAFYMPSGNYIVATDANSVVEVWDPIETTWRIWITQSNSESVYCDGYNFRLRNSSGSLPAQLITFGGSSVITAAGSGMTNGIGPLATGVSLTVSGGTQTAGYPTPTLYAIIGGTVQAPTITQGGTGFVTPPLIVIDPPPVGGIQATAVAALTAGGAITSITMSNPGAGYATSPNFWIIPQPLNYQGGPPGGPNSGLTAAPLVPLGFVNPANALPTNQNTAGGTTGALLTPAALTGSGTLTGVGVINPGGGYTATTAPTVAIAGGSGSPTITLPALTIGAVATVRSQPRVQ
ncbi:MAG TPA: hypothetical protein VF748_15590 [Candidatus Acidoferrum sp.]